ncbi:MAG: TonB-dependent receptor, partial [Proteobacteria bacterium]|nr:TonB-dependent receptor [Pseudomonadota bacterium]
GFAQRTNGVVPADSVVINNYDIAGPDINPVTYKGLRVGLNYKFNDVWSALLTQSYQDMNASGVFYQMPLGSENQPLDPLQVTLFNNGLTHDKFTNTALVVNGKVGPLDFEYAGARLVRDIFQVQDYTNYARGVWGSYYQCTGFSGASVDKCYSPSSTWYDTTHNVNTSHELRFTAPSDWKVSGIGGVFYEDRKLYDDTEWQYKSVPECSVGGPASCFLWLDPSAAPKFQDASMNYLGRRNSHTGFFDDFKREYKQKAVYLSLDWHITNSLTLTGGTRYYDISNEMLGGNMGSFYCKVYGTGETGPCTGALYGYGDVLAPYGTNLDRQNPHSDTTKGFKSRGNISWHVHDNVLLYATWSQGFRSSGYNRGSGCHLPSVVTTNGVQGPGPNQWCVPARYESDDLTNIEVGWKTTLLGNRLQFNGAIYQEDWK